LISQFVPFPDSSKSSYLPKRALSLPKGHFGENHRASGKCAPQPGTAFAEHLEESQVTVLQSLEERHWLSVLPRYVC